MNSIDSYALRLGIAPCISGYKKFTEAVNMYLHTDGMPTLKNICEQIGEKYLLSGKAVFRAIDYAIKTAKDLNKNLSELTGIKVYEEDIRPKYVIYLVVQCIKQALED